MRFLNKPVLLECLNIKYHIGRTEHPCSIKIILELFSDKGREELLTEHAMKWNRRKIEGLPRSLSKRYTKVQYVTSFLVFV